MNEERPRPRFVAKSPVGNPNVSKENPLTDYILLIVGLPLAFVAALLIFAAVVDQVVQRFPAVESSLCGWIQSAEFSVVGKDQSGVERLQTLVDKLSKQVQIPCPLKVIIWDDTTMENAAALPGGVMLVTKGLLKGARSENEIVFVLSHEIAHFSLRHHLRGLGRGVVLVGGAALGTDLPMLNPLLSLVGAQYSQRDESAADEVALTMVHNHYGHVGGALEFLDRAKKHEEHEIDLGNGVFRSHPYSVTRISDLKNFCATNGYGEGTPTPFHWPH